MEAAFEQAKKKREHGPKGFDVRFADELASGLRSGTTSHEQFLRAVGESRMIQKKGLDERRKKEDSEFAKKARDEHERGVKIELKAMLDLKKLAFPASETILKKKKKRKGEDEPEEERKEREEVDELTTEREKLRELGEKWGKDRQDEKKP